MTSTLSKLREFLTPKRTTLRKAPPQRKNEEPREETWEDETPLPTITRDELLKLQGKNNQ